MRAVAYRHARPVTAEDALVDIEIGRPALRPHDLLVKVEAVSVNPVDTKIRRNSDPGGEARVLGFDAAGTVAEVGEEVTLFKPGDHVWYAGSNLRPGTNSEFHAVDERIVGLKPASLDFAEAAALPLTALTAWELLFDRIGVKQGPAADRRSLLIVGGAGGVGSIAIQLARMLTELTVMATASRPETMDWAMRLGARHVINHSQPLQPQLSTLGHPAVDIVTAFAGSQAHAAAIADIIAPEGHVGLIEGSSGITNVELGKFFQNCVTLHFELMFMRPRLDGGTMIRQHEILSAVAVLVDHGKIRTTLTKRLSPISAATLREAHELVESGSTIGKVVVEGWP